MAKKRKTYAQLKKALDRVFSEFIRRQGGEYPTCITCGAVHAWKVIQCGHFVSRVHLSTRWERLNCAPQCFACNVWKRGSPAEFALALQKKYGPGIIQELVDKKHQEVKFSRSELEGLISDYKAKALKVAA
jgi:hypothetical protein